MTMIKRKDGSYSKRGLWDNIRANKGSVKKPTAEMLKQEKKIKSKEKKLMGGKKKLYKKAGFPDLSGDGKITQKDILMGKGVIGKKKKQMGGALNPAPAKPSKGMLKDSMPKPNRAKNTGSGYVKLTSNPPKYRNLKTGKTISEAEYKNMQGKMKKTVTPAKKKMMGGKKKMMGGKKSMYQSGGFLEPGIERLS